MQNANRQVERTRTCSLEERGVDAAKMDCSRNFGSTAPLHPQWWPQTKIDVSYKVHTVPHHSTNPEPGQQTCRHDGESSTKGFY